MGFRRMRDGRFRVQLGAVERELLRKLPAELTELLETDHPAIRRLFPPAYAEDPQASEEFDRLMRSDLLERHRANLHVLEATAGATELDEEQMEAWLGAVNDLRLAMGTHLDITEDLEWEHIEESDPRLPAFAIYLALGEIAGELVDALMDGVDRAGHPGAQPPPPREGSA